MKIAIDLRSLQSGNVSGVENYTLNLLDFLLSQDRANQYVLFYNSLRRRKLPDMHFINSRLVHTRWPNKILNIGFKIGAVNLEKFVGPVDWLLMPNLNQFHLSPQTKLALTVHDLSPIVTPEFYDAKRRLWHKFLNYRKAFERADVLFAVSEYTKRDLIKLFNINSQKIKVIYPGIDDKVFKPAIAEYDQRLARNIYGLPGKFILFLGTIEPRKNLAGVIRAFERINTDAFLVVAGRPGWKYGRDFDLMRRSPKSGKIKYIGYVEEAHKPALIKLAAVLVYPSFYEGFGFQALEAMAVGTPVIASQVTSLPEVAADNALLVNPYNTDSLAQSLIAALTDRPLVQKMTADGLTQARKFSWQGAAAQILNYLTEIKV